MNAAFCTLLETRTNKLRVCLAAGVCRIQYMWDNIFWMLHSESQKTAALESEQEVLNIYSERHDLTQIDVINPYVNCIFRLFNVVNT